MVKPEPSTAGPKTSGSILESKTFFNTLEYAAVPHVATDLFIPLIRQLQEEWDVICGAAEPHLNYMAGQASPFGDLS